MACKETGLRSAIIWFPRSPRATVHIKNRTHADILANLLFALPGLWPVGDPAQLIHQVDGLRKLRPDGPEAAGPGEPIERRCSLNSRNSAKRKGGIAACLRNFNLFGRNGHPTFVASDVRTPLQERGGSTPGTSGSTGASTSSGVGRTVSSAGGSPIRTATAYSYCVTFGFVIASGDGAELLEFGEEVSIRCRALSSSLS
jgi:hypothetical protein